MGGFVQVAREYDGVELIGITSPLFPRPAQARVGHHGSHEHFVGIMIEELKASLNWTVSFSRYMGLWPFVASRPEAISRVVFEK